MCQQCALGATVRVQAVALTYFNTRGEHIGAHFVTGRPGDLIVEKPARADPFAVPLVPLTGLRPFSPDGPDYGRVRLLGQVTLSRQGRCAGWSGNAAPSWQLRCAAATGPRLSLMPRCVNAPGCLRICTIRWSRP